MAKLTKEQARVLQAVDQAVRYFALCGGQELAQAIYGSPLEDAHGLHLTAASLTRRGLLSKSRIRGLIYYELTEAGRAELSLARQAQRRAERAS